MIAVMVPTINMWPMSLHGTSVPESAFEMWCAGTITVTQTIIPKRPTKFADISSTLTGEDSVSEKAIYVWDSFVKAVVHVSTFFTYLLLPRSITTMYHTPITGEQRLTEADHNKRL